MINFRHLFNYKANLFFFLLTLVTLSNLFAEGTRTVSPSSANITALGLLPSVGSGSYMGCTQDNRIYFRIKDHTTENLYFGFNWCVYQNTSPSVNPSINTVYMRVYTSAGVQVGTPIQLNNTGAGFISTYAQAFAGPNIGGATPTGYTPLTFDPTANDDYYIEIYKSTDGGVTQDIATNWTFAPYFDLTVAKSNNTQYTGRVHCDKWSFVAIDPTTLSNLALVSSDVSVVGYTSDSIYVKFDIQLGFQPIAFNLSMNSYGVTNTSNWTTTDRQSINSATTPTLSNGFPLFLNAPDSTLYPYSPVPTSPTFENPVMIGCGAGGPFKIRYKVYQTGDVYILFDVNGTPGFQANTTDRLVEGINQTPGSKVYTWDGKDGLGNILPTGTNVPLQISLRRGRVNFPMYDAELNKNGFILGAVRPQVNATLRMYWDDSQLTNVGGTCGSAANNANNITGIGYSVALEGKVSPSHAWNGDGNSSNAIPAAAVSGNDADQFQCNDFGNVRVINTWAWGAEANVNQNVSISCVTVSGTIWDDANNSANGTNTNVFTAGETGTNVGATLFATLIDPLTGLVLQSVAVAANGTYSFSNAPLNAANLVVRLTNTLGTVDNTPPALATIPATWVTTSPLTQNITTTNVNLSNIDFGVERLPIPTNNTAASQVNPGGTNQATVPASTFQVTDADGTTASIRITSFPTNITSITISGTQYTSATFPVGGVTIVTNTTGNPLQTITVDPIGGANTVVISYKATDNAGKEGTVIGTASVPFTTVGISGNVYDDANGLTDAIVNGSATNASNTLYANLLDNSGNVVAKTSVSAGGIYSFSGLESGSYAVQISTNQGTIGNPAPATALPSNWVNTGENIGTSAGDDGTPDGNLPVTLTTTSVTNANFGIEQLPVAANNTATSQVNPGGTNNVTVGATNFTATDVDGTVTSIKITSFPTNATSITINGTQYISATFPVAGIVIPANASGNPTQAILVDPINGAVTVGIPYIAIDNAGKEGSTNATASVPFTTLSLSGNVFDDANGLTDAIVNGTATNAGNTLYANLLNNNGDVIATMTVPVGGNYTFAGLDMGNYTIQISTNQGTVGSAAPTTALPSNWVNTGENVGIAAGNDGTVDGALAVTLTTTNISNVNFGIEQKPTANNNTAAMQTNPAGLVNITIPASTFSGADIDGTLASIRLTAFPPTATTITVNGITYSVFTFPAGGITIPANASGNPTQSIQADPASNAVSVVFPYVTIDNAGKESATGNATQPLYICAANAGVTTRN